MIKLIQKYIHRLKYGYEITDDLYLSSPSKDEFVITDANNRKLKIYFECLAGLPDIVLYKSDNIRYLPPYENEIISEQQYQYIINAVIKHFERLGEVVEYK